MNNDWFASVLPRFPWIMEKRQNCIISPDCDGILCGLLMSHLLEWRVRGFYDGKIMAVAEKCDWRDCVFLDMEIFRQEVRSVGQHMLLVNRNRPPNNWHNFDNCLSPNNLRGMDSSRSFKWKYPLGTVHLLMASLSGGGIAIPLPATAAQPLLYVDGTFKNLLNYPENCLDWLEQMGYQDNVLGELFQSDSLTLHSLMLHMRDFFGVLEQLSQGGSKADKIVISERGGGMMNFVQTRGCFQLSEEEKAKHQRFAEMLADKTGWEYATERWSYDELTITPYQKTRGGIKPTVREFNPKVEQDNPPLSWAIISALAVEMTEGERTSS